jgi:hypothetical protein
MPQILICAQAAGLYRGIPLRYRAHQLERFDCDTLLAWQTGLIHLEQGLTGTIIRQLHRHASATRRRDRVCTSAVDLLHAHALYKDRLTGITPLHRRCHDYCKRTRRRIWGKPSCRNEHVIASTDRRSGYDPRLGDAAPVRKTPRKAPAQRQHIAESECLPCVPLDVNCQTGEGNTENRNPLGNRLDNLQLENLHREGAKLSQRLAFSRCNIILRFSSTELT